jgi:hypothetical protein
MGDHGKDRRPRVVVFSNLLSRKRNQFITRRFNNQPTLFAVQSKSIASLSRIVLDVLATTGPVSKSSDAESSKSFPESSYVGSALISLAYVQIAGVISPRLAALRSRAFWERLFRLGIVESLRRLKERCVKNFDLGRKSETRGKKYNIVANAFFSWVSFLKKILSKF